MASKRDYYEVLGISKNATEKEIKTAYRKLAMKYHPDILKDGSSDAKMRELNEAYDTLSDAEKRKEYDLYGPDGPDAGGSGFSGASGFSGFGGFDSFFSTIFGGGGQDIFGGTSEAASKPMKGQDLLTKIKISFHESMVGKKIEQKLTKYENCSFCHGTGAKTKSSIKLCGECKGNGKVKIIKKGLFGSTEVISTCSRCRGTGKVITEKCTSCNGEQILKKIKTVTLNIAPGTENGKKIRVEGYGEKGRNGGPAGDLYLLIEVAPHKFFKREGNTLYLKIPVSFLDIVLENTIKIPTPYGVETIKLKNTYKNGTILKLAGKGVRTKTSVGDLKIKIEVVMADLTPGQYANLASRISGFKDNTNDDFVKEVSTSK
ncbi:DnaJ C-terminal domain-containing protein [Mycoplasmopsis hyopharyngis]|uniref:DnaJ C-terminal domain-containing protein n=1 Tax=Mycoplasmopsis hyopharyngis TaxID=29558 RepID=UPI0038731C6D